MKHRILIVNKFYYPRGGDCIVAMNMERLLQECGHEVRFFAMDYPENIDSPYSDSFASQIDFASGLRGKIRAFSRAMGWGDINKTFKRVLDDFKPDIVHIHNIHSYLSPAVALLAKKAGCKVIWTLHDYKLLCPSYSCLYEGSVCEDCFSNKLPVLKKRCMKGSLAASVVAYLEARKWSKGVLEHNVDAFICPSEFMRSKMVQGGFSPDKLKVVCNFVGVEKYDLLKGCRQRAREPYYCYIGRLSSEKGIDKFLEVASRLPYKFKVIGDGPLGDELRQKYVRNANIEFVGRLDSKGVCDVLSKSKFSVMPSVCYENNPLGVIESLCTGTPVVGSNMGGIPELIGDSTGIVFDWESPDQAVDAIAQAWDREWDYDAIQSDSLQRFSAKAYLQELDALMD